MVLSSTSASVVEVDPKCSCCQRQCSQGETQFPTASPVALPRLASLTRLLSNYCLCGESQSMWGFCGHPERAEYLFPLTSLLSSIQTLQAFKARHSGGSFPSTGPLSQTVLCGAQTTCFLGKIFCNYYPSFCELPPWSMDLHPTMSLASFFISGVVKIFSISLQVVLKDTCSFSDCNFGMPLGEGELRVFLPCHFGHNPICPVS